MNRSSLASTHPHSAQALNCLSVQQPALRYHLRLQLLHSLGMLSSAAGVQLPQPSQLFTRSLRLGLLLQLLAVPTMQSVQLSLEPCNRLLQPRLLPCK